ncbi:MAG: HAD family hydrolase [Pseudorhodobacter sp.]|nr:HAD family hydrolase [Pseudorhodobacter sp.]
MSTITTIGFDADDTLWHNERLFHLTQARFADLLADYADPAHLADRLDQAERRNLGHYGFGVKGFVLSMIETAIEVTAGRVPGTVISQLLASGQEMLRHPTELLPEARETVAALAGQYRLVLITKGDLHDQERKLAQSGLGEFFDAVEIVSDKRPDTYTRLFARHGSGAAEAVMVGNSLKSDVLPMLAAGGWGAHVPHALTWAVEHERAPEGHGRFVTLEDLGALPAWLAAVNRTSG